jgi:hypothetical protein
MEPITLPRFEWFCPNVEQPWTFNVYSASRGTDKDGGCIENPSFNYKVKVKVEEGQPHKLHVSYFILPPWPKERDPNRVGEAIFECSQEGLEAVVAWLNEEVGHLYE